MPMLYLVTLRNEGSMTSTERRGRTRADTGEILKQIFLLRTSSTCSLEEVSLRVSTETFR